MYDNNFLHLRQMIIDNPNDEKLQLKYINMLVLNNCLYADDYVEYIN